MTEQEFRAYNITENDLVCVVSKIRKTHIIGFIKLGRYITPILEVYPVLDRGKITKNKNYYLALLKDTDYIQIIKENYRLDLITDFSEKI